MYQKYYCWSYFVPVPFWQPREWCDIYVNLDCTCVFSYFPIDDQKNDNNNTVSNVSLLAVFYKSKFCFECQTRNHEWFYGCIAYIKQYNSFKSTYILIKNTGLQEHWNNNWKN